MVTATKENLDLLRTPVLLLPMSPSSILIAIEADNDEHARRPSRARSTSWTGKRRPPGRITTMGTLKDTIRKGDLPILFISRRGSTSKSWRTTV